MLPRHPVQEERLAAATSLTGADGALSTWLQRVDGALAHHASGFVAGAALTVADLQLWNLCNWLSGGASRPALRHAHRRAGKIAGVPLDFVARFPHVAALRDRVEALPAVIKYRASGGK